MIDRFAQIMMDWKLSNLASERSASRGTKEKTMSSEKSSMSAPVHAIVQVSRCAAVCIVRDRCGLSKCFLLEAGEMG